MLEVRYVDNESILHALASGVSIVTANRRQAATLGSRFAAYVQASGQRVWATPDVLSWQAWLLRAWQHQVFSHGHGVQRLLNESQEQLLWERILRSSSRADSLLQITATAKRLREAATLMHHWQISPRALEREYNEDVCAFREWWQQLMAICRKGGWLLPAQLADAVFTTADAGSETQLATRLWLFGFDEINPQQAALVLRLQQMGHSVEWVMLQGQEADAHLVMCDDLRSQALLAARGARARLEQHPHRRHRRRAAAWCRHPADYATTR